ncbi:MAG: hypothetical protein V3S29_12465 [bacterium]
MDDPKLLEQAFHFAIATMVNTGSAPHYTDFARAFSQTPEEGKALLHGLLATGIPAWVCPDTDYIASFAPFANLPSQYRISVAGEQKWYGQ